jgi:hypothetical protein
MTTGRRRRGSPCCSAERLEDRTLLAATVVREVVSDFGGSEVADDVIVQRDGRVIVLGHTEGAVEAGGGRLFLARYEVDGTLDPFFGEDGRIFGEFPEFPRGSSLALDRSGRIYVAGVTDGTEGRNPLDPTIPPDPAVAVVPRCRRSRRTPRSPSCGSPAAGSSTARTGVTGSRPCRRAPVRS